MAADYKKFVTKGGVNPCSVFILIGMQPLYGTCSEKKTGDGRQKNV